MLFTRYPIQKERQKLKAKGWKKYFMQMERKAAIAILTSHNIDFKTMAIVQDKERYYIMIKGTTNKRI